MDTDEIKLLLRSKRLDFVRPADLVVFFCDLPVLQHFLQISTESVSEPHQVVSLPLALSQAPLTGLQF